MALSVTSAPWEQVNMPSLDLRRFVSALLTSEGVQGSGDMAVTQRGAGANMSTDIAAGKALVQGDSVAFQGMYLAYNDATVNLTGFTASHATLPRVDRVVLRVRDAFHGDAANDEAFIILTGTATSGATLANLTGAAAVGNSQLLLANILIPAASASITTANIDTTVRPKLTLASPAPGTELAYTEFTAPVTISATTEATANTIVTAPAVTFDGATAVNVEFFTPKVILATSVGAEVVFALYDGAASIGLIGDLINSAAAGSVSPASLSRRLTPSAAAHTYSVRAWRGVADGTIIAGTGGVGAYLPGYIKITKA